MRVYRGAVAVLALTLRRDRRRAARGHGGARRRRARLPARRPLHRARRRPADAAAARAVARWPASCAASSASSTRRRSSRSPTARSPRRIYFALGIVAAYALGLTPLVLLGAGIFFLIVSLSYAEATAAIPETGGAATFVRRAYNDVLGFLTGWALFLDYLIVIALSALFLPHYLGTALGIEELRESPWDVVVAVAVILAITAVRLARRSQLHTAGLVVAGTRPRDAAAARDPRPRAALLAGRAHAGHRPRRLADLGRARLRAAARDARVHGARDGRQPRRGDARARADAAAQPLLRDRPRRRAHRRRRGRRHLRLPGRERRDGARRRVAEGAARRHRRRARGPRPRPRGRRAPRLRRPDRCARAARRRDDVDLGLHAARPLARRASAAAAELRPAEPADARLAAGDRRRRRDLDRARDRHAAVSATTSPSSPASTPSASCSPSPPRSWR